jgi:enoyl-CoA hydratase/carnithine racemase
MNPKNIDARAATDWAQVERAVEGELLDRAREVARRITERVKKLTEDTSPGPALMPDEPTGEAPAVM